jgi:hypothetical protein
MKPANITALMALVACAVLAALLMRARQQIDIDQAQIASLQNANRDLTAHVGDLEQSHIDEAILKRLQADQREAIKLRGEVAKLKKSLASAESAAAAAAQAAQKSASTTKDSAGTPTDPGENPFVRVLGRKLKANVPLGHAVVFGGWQSAPGKQSFAITIPTLVAGTTDEIAVQTKWIEVADEALSKFDPALLLRAANQQVTLSPDQIEAFVKADRGVDILSSPTMTISSGRAGQIASTETRTTPNGPVEFGPVMNFTPTLAADGATVDLALEAKLTVPAAESTASK